MGLIRALKKVLGLFLLGTFLNHCMASDAVTLEKRPWPADRKCNVCVTIQFMTMEMRLPLTEIGKVLAIEGYGLHILPRSGEPKKSVSFLTLPPERLRKRYEEDGFLQGLDVKTNEQFFDILGRPPEGNKSLAIMRRIERIDTATRYTKATRGPVHAYWIQQPLPGSSAVHSMIYFVIDGEETVYELAGDITPAFYEAVLSNLRIVKIP